MVLVLMGLCPEFVLLIIYCCSIVTKLARAIKSVVTKQIVSRRSSSAFPTLGEKEDGTGAAKNVTKKSSVKRGSDSEGSTTGKSSTSEPKQKSHKIDDLEVVHRLK